MASLTVTEAAQRLGVKPAKVRRYIGAHKLSARAVPTVSGTRGRTQVMLDADEVEAFAIKRIAKSRARAETAETSSATHAGAGQTAGPAETVLGDIKQGGEPAATLAGQVEQAELAESLPRDTRRVGESREALSGQVEQEGAHLIDPTGQRTVALVQSMLAPLVAELHDARETIRRQAEELGALRAAVTELERRATLIPATTSPSANGSRDTLVSVPPPLLKRDAATPAHAPTRPGPARPVWRRAVTHLFGR